MVAEIWTKEQEDYLRYLYSKDCMILDFVSNFNKKFGTNRSKQSLVRKAERLGINSDFIGGSRYNHITFLMNKKEKTGETNMSNDGTLMKIIEYKGANDVLIEFQDDVGYKVWVAYSDFKRGVVKNPYCKQRYNLDKICEVA